MLDRSDPDDCCLRVCLSVGYKGEPCKNAKPIEMPFGGLTREGQRNHLLDGVEIPKGKRQFVELVVWPFEQHCESLLRFTKQNSNNGISATTAVNCIPPNCPVSH